LPDGTHTLTVVVVQSDLLSTNATVSFATHNQLDAATKTISSLNGSVSSLRSTVNSMTDLVYLAVAVAVIAVAVAAYALRKGTAPWKY
jgi:hypothetical protein